MAWQSFIRRQPMSPFSFCRISLVLEHLRNTVSLLLENQKASVRLHSSTMMATPGNILSLRQLSHQDGRLSQGTGLASHCKAEFWRKRRQVFSKGKRQNLEGSDYREVLQCCCSFDLGAKKLICSLRRTNQRQAEVPLARPVVDGLSLTKLTFFLMENGS